MSRKYRNTFAVASLIGAVLSASVGAQEINRSKFEPVTIQEQGSFAVGGKVITAPGSFDPIKQGNFNPAGNNPAGETLHGDHAYVFYQMPVNPRKLPLVFLHGTVSRHSLREAPPHNLRPRTTESEIDDDVLLRSRWSIEGWGATLPKVPESPITDILYSESVATGLRMQHAGNKQVLKWLAIEWDFPARTRSNGRNAATSCIGPDPRRSDLRASRVTPLRSVPRAGLTYSTLPIAGHALKRRSDSLP